MSWCRSILYSTLLWQHADTCMPFVSGSGVHLVKQRAHVVWLRALLCNWDDPCPCEYVNVSMRMAVSVLSVCVWVCMCVCVWTPGCLQWRRPSVSVWRWKGRAGLVSINQARLQRHRDLQLPSTTQPLLLNVTDTHTPLTPYGLVDIVGLYCKV